MKSRLWKQISGLVMTAGLVLATTAGSVLSMPVSVGATEYDPFAEVSEEGSQEQSGSGTVVNSVYEGVLSEADIDTLIAQQDAENEGLYEGSYGDWNNVLSADQAAVYIKNEILARGTQFTVYLPYNGGLDNTVKEILGRAYTHNGNPKEGDYLRFHTLGYHYSWQSSGSSARVDYTMTYAATAAQEQQVDAMLPSVMASLNLDGKTRSEKIEAIYQYICDRVAYDYTNFRRYGLRTDFPYPQMFSAYAALINRTSVCQGYANLFYRMALTAGIDCRIISGLGNGGAHAWNIVKCGQYYYNIDVTFDEARNPWDYFMLNEANFNRDHTRQNDNKMPPYIQYASTAFYNQYPMAPNNWEDMGITEGTDSPDFSASTPSQQTQPSQQEQPVQIGKFSDVTDSGKWYYQPVYWAVEEGITNGVSLTRFGVNDTCTRAQAMTFIWKTYNSPDPYGISTFTDVAQGKWYTNPIAWAVNAGITNGVSKTQFGVNNPCTRAQIVTFLWKAERCPESEYYSGFADVDTGKWYSDAVDWAVENGITNGTGNNCFSPNQPCTRAQIVTFLYKLCSIE